jgi:hypothetical protein
MPDGDSAARREDLDGMKGIYVSLAGGDIAGYDVLLDAQGKPAGPAGTRSGDGAHRLPAGARRTWCQAREAGPTG